MCPAQPKLPKFSWALDPQAPLFRHRKRYEKLATLRNAKPQIKHKLVSILMSTAGGDLGKAAVTG